MKAWKGPDWIGSVIPKHRSHYESVERPGFQYALREYQGKHYTEQDRRRLNTNPVSFNMLFAIVESAITMLCPTNLQYSITAGGEDGVTTEYTRPKMEKDLERLSRRGKWQAENVLALTDALLYGRYLFKVTLCDNYPSVRAVKPQNVYFDLSARRPADVEYFIEMTPYHPEDIQAKDKQGVWSIPNEYKGAEGLKALQRKATSYPVWMSEAAHKTTEETWVLVYEVWDCKRKQYTVWIDDTQEPFTLLEGDKFWNPWVLGNLIYNGENCAGLSEVQVIKDLTEAINRLLTNMMITVRKQVGLTLYDSKQVGQEAVAAIATAQPGDYVPVEVGADGSLASAFRDGPIVQFTADLVNLEAKLESMVGYVSALSDTARGQTVGAKTATELALIESQQRTRLNHRTTNFHSVCAEAAAKAMLLHMKKPISYLPDLMESVALVASNAVQTNRNVLQEKFQTIQAYLISRPDGFDTKELDKLFVQVFDLPESLILPATPQGAPMGMEMPAPGQAPPEGEAGQAIEQAVSQLPPEVLQAAMQGAMQGESA